MRILIPAEQIAQRVAELAARIDADYPAGTLCLVAVLKGSCIFAADLARAIRRDVRLEFLGTASYGKQKSSSGEVKLTKDLDSSVEGAHVLLVEDIIDSGITLTYLLRLLEQRKPLSLKIVSLLDKPERRQRPVHADYVGFQIPNQFVVGYGLDHNEQYRNLKDICVIEDEPGP